MVGGKTREKTPPHSALSPKANPAAPAHTPVSPPHQDLSLTRKIVPLSLPVQPLGIQRLQHQLPRSSNTDGSSAWGFASASTTPNISHDKPTAALLQEDSEMRATFLQNSPLFLQICISKFCLVSIFPPASHPPASLQAWNLLQCKIHWVFLSNPPVVVSLPEHQQHSSGQGPQPGRPCLTVPHAAAEITGSSGARNGNPE